MASWLAVTPIIIERFTAEVDGSSVMSVGAVVAVAIGQPIGWCTIAITVGSFAAWAARGWSAARVILRFRFRFRFWLRLRLRLRGLAWGRI